VQCIRELRQKLGDHEHRLIKTVSRRGYLLDAALRTPQAASPSWSFQRLRERFTSLPSPRDLAVNLIASIVAWGQLTREKPGRALFVAATILVLASTAGVFLLGRGSTDPAASLTAKVSVAPVVVQSPRPTFKDCSVCPEMVELPAGEFTMGSPADEVGRKQVEGPQRRVTIAKRFALGKFEITIEQFAAFVAETGLAAGNTCQVLMKFEGAKELWSRPQALFLQPGFEVKGSHPAVCVSGHDAQAYAAWLRRRTGKPYRLPTEAEWEYAARAGTTTPFSFGIDETQLCAYARFADLGSPFGWRGGCRSDVGFYGTLPVGSLKSNPWGIADMHGNASEWVEDCWTADVRKIPTDGSAFTHPGGCEVGVIRGGSFASPHRSVRSAYRRANIVAKHYQTIGFRVAVSLDAQ
jgi:sulfatase modifying factor 1